MVGSNAISIRSLMTVIIHNWETDVIETFEMKDLVDFKASLNSRRAKTITREGMK